MQRRKTGSDASAFADMIADDLVQPFRASIANAAGSLAIAIQIASLARQERFLPRLREALHQIEDLVAVGSKKVISEFDDAEFRHELTMVSDPISIFTGPMAGRISRFLEDRIKAVMPGIAKGEVSLLISLLKSAGNIASKEVLKLATKSRSRNAASVRVQISRLRTRMLKYGQMDLIKTEVGGYMISKDDALRLYEVLTLRR